MTSSGPVLELKVLVDGNVVLGERLTRSLRAELGTIDGVDVQFAQPAQSDSDQAKSGSGVWDAALWVFLGTATNATARVLIEKIKAWSARERGRTVRITSGDEVIEVNGSGNEAQERIITKFLESRRP